MGLRARHLRRMVAVTLLASVAPVLAADRPHARDGRGEFPVGQPTTRGQAVDFLLGDQPLATRCLTPTLQERALGGSPVVRRSIALLKRRVPFAREQLIQRDDGIVVRYTSDPNAFDGIPVTSGNGMPSVVAATLDGLDAAVAVLVEQLELPRPENLEVLLVELDDRVDGYTARAVGRSSRMRLVLDATPTGGADAARRAAIHQFAHAVALSAGSDFAPGWAEAFANWSEITLSGAPRREILALLGARIDALSAGLLNPDATLLAGNAIWLAFLEESYGMPAIRATIEELAEGGPSTTALDRAVRRASNDDLAAAFREFHLWSVLVGEQSTGHHFPFAAGLRPARFASDTSGLPALSVQSDAPVAPLGAAQIRVRPEERRGGATIHFEGDFSARWEADLILVGDDGEVRRVAMQLEDGRGDLTVPLDGVAEAILLVRNIGSDDDGAHRYTYAIHHEKGFPFELVAREVSPVGAGDGGLVVSWETSSERQLLGFNVLRYREDGESPTAINPVWIPALGEPDAATSYSFVDHSAKPGIAYRYRVQGITRDGLTSLSGPFGHDGSAPR